jgi:outer membrane protein, heavy metal efflux system
MVCEKMLRKRYFNFSTLLMTSLFVLALVSTAESQGNPNFIPRRLTLSQAESLLVERNLTVIAARYQVDVNRAARLIASYKLNPMLTVGAEQVPFYSPLAGSYPRFATTNPDAGANPVYTLRFDQIWERGGKRELRTAVAEEQLLASEAQLLDALRNQIFQMRRTFAAAILARENLKLAETVEQQYAQTEKLTLAKVDQGDIAKVEIYRVGAGRLQYQQTVLQARTAYETAVRDVLNLLGAREQEVEPAVAQTFNPRAVAVRLSNSVESDNEPQFPESLRNAPLQLVSDFDDQPVFHTLNELRSIAVSERPDVAAARHLLTSAERATQLAVAQRTRDVDIGYEYQRVGSDHSAGVVVSVPLFLHNNQRALATQAEASQRTAEAQLKQAELQAITDVDKAYQSYLTARQVLDLYSRENLSQLDRLRMVANVSYREGASSLFELLDAQRAYSLAMTSYNQARSDYQTALWQLEQAVASPLR